MRNLNIPVGVSVFSEIRQNGYYYVDKSRLIFELLKTTANEVTLIIRPRRFGKTLGISMLASFFDIRKDSRKLFEGLEITENRSSFSSMSTMFLLQRPTAMATTTKCWT